MGVTNSSHLTREGYFSLSTLSFFIHREKSNRIYLVEPYRDKMK